MGLSSCIEFGLEWDEDTEESDKHSEETAEKTALCKALILIEEVEAVLCEVPTNIGGVIK
jgi:hypothetical protein